MGGESVFKNYLFSKGSEIPRCRSAVEMSTPASPLDCGNVSKTFGFQMTRGLEGGREHVQKPIVFKRV